MENIQQKLVWLMGSGAILLLLLRLNLRRIGVGKFPLRMMKIGLALILAGAAFGVIYRISLSIGASSSIWPVYFLETTLGYLAGWALVVYGLLLWAGDYFDRKGRPLARIDARALAENVAHSLIRAGKPNQIINNASDDIKGILSCQAITFHRVRNDESMFLVYAVGVTSHSKELISAPADKNHMFWAAGIKNRPVATGKELVFGEGMRLQSDSGPLLQALCLPVVYGNDVYGVITLYRSHDHAFDEEDANTMRVVCDAVGVAIQNEDFERNSISASRREEMLALAAKSFENGEPLVSALIKSAKTVHGYIPFKRIVLYIHGDGQPRSSNFSLPTGGEVSVITGYLPTRSFPEIYPTEKTNRQSAAGSSLHGNANSCSQYVIPIGSGGEIMAHLMFEFDGKLGRPAHLPLVARTMAQKVGESLQIECFEKKIDKARQWMGALRCLVENGGAQEDINAKCKRMTSAVVDLAPVTCCRIILDNGRGEFPESVESAQARISDPNSPEESRLTITRESLHRRFLETSENTHFDLSGAKGDSAAAEQIRTLFPDNIDHGMIVPLRNGDRTIGLLAVGESRNSARAPLKNETELFISAVAGLVSTAFAGPPEEFEGAGHIEGKKSLKLRRREIAGKNSVAWANPKFRSKVNGPLAGILASCEYLRSSSEIDSDEKVDLGRFIDVIERNAAKIHKLTAGVYDGDIISG